MAIGKADKESFYSFLKKIPKVEIHLHAEAVIGHETAGKFLARDNSIYKDLDEVKKFFNYDNLDDFVEAFLQVQKSFKNIEDFSLLFREIGEYLKANGIFYTELFFSPTYFIKNGFSFNQMLKTIEKEIDSIKDSEQIEIKLLIDVSRTFGVENARQNLNMLLDYLKANKSDKIIGIGLGGAEDKGPAGDFKEIFQTAKDNNLRIVAHAGEVVGPESIWDALTLLGAERIGHGITSIYDEKLLDYLRKKRIPLEVCPTSNIFTKKYVKEIEAHPIRILYDRGLLITLNTDDPTFFTINLIDEFWNLYSKLNFSLSEIKQLILNGIEASFLPQNKKAEAVSKVITAWNTHIASLD